MMGLLRRLGSMGTLAARQPGEFQRLKVALVSDELTRSCLSLECRVRDITPLNYKVVLALCKPDLLFVESAWQGAGNAWKFKIASYPDHPERNHAVLRRVVEYARNLGIPCVFWNKEDGVHFDRFIASAALFDTVFTVDENCISRYRSALGHDLRVESLMFAIQPRIHSPSFESAPVLRRASFVGSYNHHIHDRRRAWQDMMFRSAADLGVTVFDRNSSRHSASYRYPAMPGLDVKKQVPHDETAQIYRTYAVSLNVNTVEDSPTMFSRRLIEIIACGGLAATNPALSVERYFKDFCEVVHSEDQCVALFERLRLEGPSTDDIARARAGADYVLRNHTWSHRLAQILNVVT
jgi:spore maturation protein CgeB